LIAGPPRRKPKGPLLSAIKVVAPPLVVKRPMLPSSRLVGLRHFLAPLGAENLSAQGKEVDDLKTPETLVNTRFMHILVTPINYSFTVEAIEPKLVLSNFYLLLPVNP
jgi:hypothetical protein